jgi:dihydroorotase
MDVLVTNSKIVPLPKDAPVNPSDVKEIIECKGYYVFPGLVDFHAHFSWNHCLTGVEPDLYTLPSGVTSACDAGSTGSSGFESFVRTTILPSLITLKASINVASGGLSTPQYMEDIRPENYDIKGLEDLFERYGEHILGLKLRLGKDISDGMGVEPLKASVKLARQFHTRLSVHATYPLTPVAEIVGEMQEGDVLCHTFQKMGEHNIMDEKGKVRPEVWEARKRGVIFDCAHGRIHCCFPLAKAAIEQGFLPDTISTDLITFSAYQERLFSLPVVMSRLWALGMPLGEVVRCCTETPAKLMGLEGTIGTLKPGALADITVMKLEKRDFTFADSYGNSLDAHNIMIPQMTVKAGRTRYRQIDFTQMFGLVK